MARPALEVADIFRGHGAAWRHANHGRSSLATWLRAVLARFAVAQGHIANANFTLIAFVFWLSSLHDRPDWGSDGKADSKGHH